MKDQKPLELLPCPFCGGEAEFITSSKTNYEGKIVLAKCSKCTGWYDIDKWNTRALPSKGTDERTEKLKDLVKIQSSKGCYDVDEYMRGMANGLICALSCFTDEEPKYHEPPSKGMTPLEWFTTPNPLLGNMIPVEMIKDTRYRDKLCKFIINSIDENSLESKGTPASICTICGKPSIIYQGLNGFRCEDHVLFGESKGMVEKETNMDETVENIKKYGKPDLAPKEGSVEKEIEQSLDACDEEGWDNKQKAVYLKHKLSNPKEGSSADGLNAAMTVIQDMCDHEKEIRQLASIHIGKHEAFGDSYGVPIISEVVKLLVAKLSAKPDLVPISSNKVKGILHGQGWYYQDEDVVIEEICSTFGTPKSELVELDQEILKYHQNHEIHEGNCVTCYNQTKGF